jgi:diguanylate cyclase (GGDEF)-like protein/PAS domain S-box-containing protein
MKEMELDYKYLLDNLNDGVYIVDRERKIIYWNKAAERLTGFTKEEVIGSHCYDNILNHVDMTGKVLCTQDCPLSWTMEDGRFREVDVALRQKNGVRRPINVRTAPIRDSKGKMIGAIEVFSDNSSKIATLEKLREAKELTLIDSLTEIFNRRGLETYLENRFFEFEKRGWVFGISMLDVDDFKKINDAYGHNTGDEILKMISTILSGSSRAYDIVGRWGGEEFLVVFSHMNEALLKEITERHRVLVNTSCLDVNGGRICATVSGGATLVKEGDGIDSIVSRADAFLYRSKNSGKNRITIG